MINDSSPKIDDSSNPVFKYVMKHSHGFMKLVVAKWVNGKDLFKPDHEILTTEVSSLERYEMQGNEDLSADLTIVFKKLVKNTNKPKTLLSLAVQNNNEKMLRLLIQLGADINDYYGKYQRPLHDAVLYHKGTISVSGKHIVSSDSNMVAILLELGADYDVQNGAGETSLYTAVEFNQIDDVELLLNTGANPNLVNNTGRSPLDIATSLHRNSIIKVLLDAGANINIKNQRGLTPLMLAVFFNNTEAAKILIAAGADANIIDNQGNTAMGMSRTRQMRNVISNRGNQSMCVIS
jgi:ankyrin repeat protein